jgi:DNA-binding MurR/RpiR family transcriptional regulator
LEEGKTGIRVRIRATRRITVPKGTPESGFRKRLVNRAVDLPPQQKAIADYVLEHLTAIPFFSVPELAKRTGVSEATVVRFAQRLGYPGFSELKMELVDLLQSRLTNGVGESAEEVVEDLLASVASLEATNIAKTVESLDRNQFSEVADSLFEADRVHTFGMGVSALLAELAAYTLLQVGVSATCLSTSFSSPREQLVGVGADDVVVVISLPPYSRQSLAILRDAADLGISTVAISDRLTSPAAGLARRALAVKSDNMMFTNAVAAVTVLINALATEIAASHREEALAALSQINRVLSEDEDLVPSRR